MKNIIKNIIELSDIANSADRFLNCVQNLFCLKHDIDIENYKKMMEYLSLGNGFKILSETIIDESLKTLALSNIVSDFDRYLDKDKREETGSYYTPPVLAEAMAKRSIADYFIKNNIIEDKKCEKLFFDNINTLSKLEAKETENSLKEIKIIDISCGTGIFLFKSLEILISVYEILNVNINYAEIAKQIFALDLQPKALEIYSLIIYDYLLDKDVKFKDLPELNICCTDSLLGEIPFEFKFDIVIGNPPYVGEKGNKEIFDIYKKTDHLKAYYEGKMDLFYFFIYRGHEILKKDGLLCYLTTNYFVTADGASKLRTYLGLNTSFYRIINFDECKLFSEAKGMHNLIFSLSDSYVEEIKMQYIDKSKKLFRKEDIYYEKYTINQNEIYSEDGNILVYESKDNFGIIQKILDKSDYRLGTIASINQGIVSGADKVTNNMFKKKLSKDIVIENEILVDEGIYVFDNNSKFDSAHFRPFYKNSDINSYFVNEDTSKTILYIQDNTDISKDSLEYKHLSRFHEVLSQRREVITGSRKWTSLQWGRDSSIFEGDKIVVPQRSLRNKFAFSDSPFYSSADVYYITKSKLPLKYLLALLNSKLMYFWLYNRGKRKGKSLELYAKPLSQIPIIKMSEDDELALIECIDKMLLNKVVDEQLLNLIDEKIYAYYGITGNDKIIIEKMYIK